MRTLEQRRQNTQMLRRWEIRNGRYASCANCGDWFWKTSQNNTTCGLRRCIEQTSGRNLFLGPASIDWTTSRRAEQRARMFQAKPWAHIRRRPGNPDPAYKFRLGEPHVGRAATGLNNVHSLHFHLRDPRGAIHEFKNLREFVRNNPSLFKPGDADFWPKFPGSLNTEARAVKGLSSLSPRCKHPRLSWKGWTWVSIHERRFNDGKDLLARNPL